MILDVKETFRQKSHGPSVFETRYFMFYCISWRNIYIFCKLFPTPGYYAIVCVSTSLDIGAT